MQPPSLRIRLVVPGNVRHNSGGNVYNAALARELTALGAGVETCPLDGGWPVGSAEDRRRLGALLRAPAGAEDRIVLVDGLLASGAPEELESAAAGRPVWILLHIPLPDHPELERRALKAAAGVICTSTSAAAGIRARHGLDGIRVALPGSDAAALAAGPLAAGSGPAHLIAVAALLPNKDQSLLLAALSRLTELPWTAALIGSDSADPAYAARLRDMVKRLGLQGRVDIPGELRGAALEAAWAAADLSLLISRAETYGLVVTESLARGIPVVVREGTGAVEALAAGTGPRIAGAEAALPGAAVALAADPEPLADVLRRWLTEPGLRARWRDAAAAARGRLPGWDATARTVLGIVAADTLDNRHTRVDSAAGQAVGE
ncbi:glycosyltransferase [Pseudarthrobacter sp. S9]|uniref:glycosyltransferase n=1 Tax=Pseudarthrobacter sp. S9 TaxID=3418421 RepID=UPI003D093E57